MKPLFLVLGFISLGLGLAGAFLPVLPTTPFAILAAYFFSKSSPKWHQYVLDMPAIGPLVKDWNTYKVIRPKAKVLSLLTIVLVMGSSIYFKKPSSLVTILMILIGCSVSTFIITRKSYR